jgi:ribulose-phosphate 3-epimerase
MVTCLHQPDVLPLVAPSILSADFGHMVADCRDVLGLGADLLHLDVMDGHFVPNLTMGPDMCCGLRRAFPDVALDVHMMVTDPGLYIEPFAKAGATLVSWHVEAVDAQASAKLAAEARGLGMLVGVAINPPTEVDGLQAYLDHADMVLVMSVNPGFSGQSFMGEVLDKVRKIRREWGYERRIQMDGGIGPSNVTQCLEAGCDVVVAASAIFGQPRTEWGVVIDQLRGNIRASVGD